MKKFKITIETEFEDLTDEECRLLCKLAAARAINALDTLTIDAGATSFAASASVDVDPIAEPCGS